MLLRLLAENKKKSFINETQKPEIQNMKHNLKCTRFFFMRCMMLEIRSIIWVSQKHWPICYRYWIWRFWMSLNDRNSIYDIWGYWLIFYKILVFKKKDLTAFLYYLGRFYSQVAFFKIKVNNFVIFNEI